MFISPFCSTAWTLCVSSQKQLFVEINRQYHKIDTGSKTTPLALGGVSFKMQCTLINQSFNICSDRIELQFLRAVCRSLDSYIILSSFFFFFFKVLSDLDSSGQNLSGGRIWTPLTREREKKSSGTAASAEAGAFGTQQHIQTLSCSLSPRLPSAWCSVTVCLPAALCWRGNNQLWQKGGGGGGWVGEGGFGGRGKHGGAAARGLCMMNWIEEDLSTETKQHNTYR